MQGWTTRGGDILIRDGHLPNLARLVTYAYEHGSDYVGGVVARGAGVSGTRVKNAQHLNKTTLLRLGFVKEQDEKY